jgi:hypothetical protein
MPIEQSLFPHKCVQIVSTSTDVMGPAEVLCIVRALLMWSTSKALVHQVS